MVYRNALWLSGLLVCTASFLVAGEVVAKDGAKAGQTSQLPGVESGYSIVKPMPEPDDEAPPNGGKQFKIGDTDVRISVTIDIGAGSVRPPRH